MPTFIFPEEARVRLLKGGAAVSLGLRQAAFFRKVLRKGEWAVIHVGGNTYQLIKENKNGWNPEMFRERYSDVLDRYDYIVGDWGYNQLRLKGFFKDHNAKGNKDASISNLQDYLNEYCNFGCAYFVVERQNAKNQRHPDKGGPAFGDSDELPAGENERAAGDGNRTSAQYNRGNGRGGESGSGENVKLHGEQSRGQGDGVRPPSGESGRQPGVRGRGAGYGGRGPGENGKSQGKHVRHSGDQSRGSGKNVRGNGPNGASRGAGESGREPEDGGRSQGPAESAPDRAPGAGEPARSGAGKGGETDASL